MTSRSPVALAILMPVRNGASTLSACLDSLKHQTYRDFRVIAIDDGSDDGSVEMLHGVSAEWANEGGPGLSVIELGRPCGIAAALMRGAEEAHGSPFLGRQDADDESLPHRLARQMEYLAEQPEIGVLATNAQTVRIGAATDGWRRYEAWLSSCHTPLEIALNLWIESPLPHPTVVMRAESYQRAGGYRLSSWPEDYDLWLRMLRAGVKMAKLPEVLYRWSDHPARASRTQSVYSPEAFLACRAHHLSRKLGGRPVIVWGAGRDGRRAARALAAEGVRLEAFLDIDPRKIGRTAYGRPILSAEAWLQEAASTTRSTSNAPMILAAVGTAGARGLIRARLEQSGFEEGKHFLCLA